MTIRRPRRKHAEPIAPTIIPAEGRYIGTPERDGKTLSYPAYLDGAFVGYFANHLEAESALNAMVYEQLQAEAATDADGAAWRDAQTAELLALADEAYYRALNEV